MAKEITVEERLGRLNRQMPCSKESEMAFLSGLMFEPVRLIPSVAAKIPPEAVYDPPCHVIYRGLLRLNERNLPVDFASLCQLLTESNMLERAGGPGFVAEISNYLVPGFFWEHHKKIVVRDWMRRRLIAACAEGIEAALDFGDVELEGEEPDARDLLSRVEEKVFTVLQLSMDVQDTDGGPVKASEFIVDYVEHLEKVMANVGKVLGMQTGLPDLDRIICGLDDKRGELAVVGARPGHGKTALLGTFLKNMTIDQGIPTLMFSMEMATDQIMDRIVFGGFGIATNKARTGMLSHADKHDLALGIRKVQGAPLWVDESSELKTVEFRARVDMLVRQEGIKLLIIDYVQLLEPCTKIGKSEERLAIAEALKVIHSLKKKHKLIILAAAQLNREIEKTPGRRHMLGDFAGSDAVGKYADYAMFIVRPAELKRWKDLTDKVKETQVRRWHEGRAAQPQMWCGCKVKEATAHPDQADEDSEADANGENGKEPFATTVIKVEDGSTWVFDNEKEWDEAAELQFVKNRNGPTPDVPVRFRRELTRFETRTPKIYSNNDDERQK